MRHPTHGRMRILVVAQQARLLTALVLHAQTLGLAIEWIRIEINGLNALDSHIASWSGPGLEQVASAITQLVKARSIGGTDSALVYNF